MIGEKSMHLREAVEERGSCFPMEMNEMQSQFALGIAERGHEYANIKCNVNVNFAFVVEILY